MPEVSVVIPTYNSAQFLGEALQSVFSQTFYDYETIVVNDGSTDDTEKVIDLYNNRIKYILQENGGPARARNYGIKESSGKYIAFLDADDIWLPSKLEKQVLMFRQRPELAMILTGNFVVNADGVPLFQVEKRKRFMEGNIAKNIFLHSGVLTSTVMVRKEIFDKIGLFEEDLRIGEDDNMWIRIAANYQIELIDEPLAKYRSHPNSLTRDKMKLFEYVQTNIRLLSQRYGGVKEKIEDAIPLKLSIMQFAMGYHFFKEQNHKEARRAFAKGIRCYIWKWQNYLYLLLSLLPISVTQKLKRIKRRLFRSPSIK